MGDVVLCGLSLFLATVVPLLIYEYMPRFGESYSMGFLEIG